MNQSRSPFEMKFSDTGGSGPVLVLLHGFPLDSSIWDAQVRGLADVARVIAPDLRGFGESSLPDPTVTINHYAADVFNLLDSLEVGKAVLCGVSMGGYVALAFQRRFPDRVRALVLVDTRSGSDSAEGKKARDEAIGLARAWGAKAVVDKMLPKMLTPGASAAVVSDLRQVMTRQSVPGIVAALEAMRDRLDTTPGLVTIDVPTLIVHGSDDTLIPLSEAVALQKTIASARLVAVPAAGHLPNYEQPEPFNVALREFLATI